MTTVNFEARKDDNGTFGLIFEGAPSHFYCVDISYKDSIRLLCHDILEHNHKKDDGSVECELMAVGAAAYGRGNHGEVLSKGIMCDIISCARDSFLEIKPLKNYKNDSIQWLIDDIDMDKLRRYIFDEFHRDIITKKQVNKFIQYAIAWINKGARRAEKRYSNSFNLYNLFDKMQREIERVSRYFDIYNEKLTIQYCAKNGTVKAIVKNIEFDY